MEYTLHNENIKVKFQSFGGEISSIQDDEGIEYLWQGDKKYWSGQAPVLFPICGSIRNNKAKTRDGFNLEMPRHGIARKREFVCEKQTEQEIIFSLSSDEKTISQYPYRFQLEIKYTLMGSTLRTGYRIVNKEDRDMPFFIGGHPGFNCPLFSSESYDDYRLEFSQPETCSVPATVMETGMLDISHRTEFLNQQSILRLSHSLFENDSVILDELKSRSVKLLSRNHKKGVRLDFEDFPYLILWSGSNNAPFIALEPWTGLPTCNDEGDIFEEKRNIQIAKRGECRCYHFDIIILGE